VAESRRQKVVGKKAGGKWEKTGLANQQFNDSTVSCFSCRGSTMMPGRKIRSKKIIISRVDNLGDVVLTLPVAGALKEHFPGTYVYFLGKPYTQSVIENCRFVDAYLNWDDFRSDPVRLADTGADTIVHVFPQRQVAEAAREAKIRHRIGTSHRLYHWPTCNRLVNLGRKNSRYHESQLSIQLLRPLGIRKIYPLTEIPGLYGWDKLPAPQQSYEHLLDKNRFNLMVHMKSYGNAKEWPAISYLELLRSLPADRFNILLTGTAEEGKIIREEVPDILKMSNVTDICGLFSLEDFLRLIQYADGMLACSTGPLHVASACGIRVLGLYPGARPKHPGRWGPVGINAEVITDNNPLDAPLEIPVKAVRERLMGWIQRERAIKQPSNEEKKP